MSSKYVDERSTQGRLAALTVAGGAEFAVILDTEILLCMDVHAHALMRDGFVYVQEIMVMVLQAYI